MNAALGGGDFAEFFEPKDGMFARILHSNDDLERSATDTQLVLQTVDPTTGDH
ncbi:TPA: hypothetical protein ACT5B2_005244 [Burkholderia cenocepacia]